jgi:hypothetical protein
MASETEGRKGQHALGPMVKYPAKDKRHALGGVFNHDREDRSENVIAIQRGESAQVHARKERG